MPLVKAAISALKRFFPTNLGASRLGLCIESYTFSVAENEARLTAASSTETLFGNPACVADQSSCSFLVLFRLLIQRKENMM
jgi:hypothetical protein